MSIKPEIFEKNVFINCPFDDNYKLPLLFPLIFTIKYLGFNPRLALECSDSGRSRIDILTDIIKECKYGIHDLSRLKSTKKGEYFRLNMPFELGIDYAAKMFYKDYLDKKILVIERDKYEYIKAISDIKGCDIKTHGNESIGIIQATRDWFAEVSNLRKVVSPEIIWEQYTEEFNLFLLEERSKLGFNEQNYLNITINEFIFFIDDWLKLKRDEAETNKETTVKGL